jgi:hypothetical protein
LLGQLAHATVARVIIVVGALAMSDPSETNRVTPEAFAAFARLTKSSPAMHQLEVLAAGFIVPDSASPTPRGGEGSNLSSATLAELRAWIDEQPAPKPSLNNAIERALDEWAARRRNERDDWQGNPTPG